MTARRSLGITLALTGLMALAPLAAAGAGGRPPLVADARGVLLTGAFDSVNYTLYAPRTVVDLSALGTEGLYFGFPQDAQVVSAVLDDEDLVTTVRYGGGLAGLSEYYTTLAQAQRELRAMGPTVMNDVRASALYTTLDNTQLRWTAEPLGRDLYRVIWNFERP